MLPDNSIATYAVFCMVFLLIMEIGGWYIWFQYQMDK